MNIIIKNLIGERLGDLESTGIWRPSIIHDKLINVRLCFSISSTDSGWDNPFRPDGDLSREADEIVNLIKGDIDRLEKKFTAATNKKLF